jgi:uncharacterized protein YjbJ (UPF0337 family)
MSAEDKTGNEVEELRGKGEAAVGRATDDPDLEAEGRAEETRGNVEPVGERDQGRLRVRRVRGLLSRSLSR